ncbi:MAG: tail fiber domain-containing protein, partial [bacterium]|nr:tail fiber domain-containing protein [bacterium]
MIRIPSFHTILSFFLGLLLLSCVLAVPALAQERRVYSGDTASLLNVDGRSIINIDRQNSRLGVGTATPAAKLDVILMGSESALLGNMRFVQAGNANYIQSGLTRTQGSWTTLHFSPYSTNQNILFTLSQNGNVGISSTSPQNKLDVVAAGTVNVARFFAGGAPSIALQTGSSGVGEGYLKWLESDAEEAGAIGVRMHNTAENYMTFRIQEEERMRISGSGLVGIGRTPTTHRLEVNGDAGKTSGGTAWVSLSDGRLKNVMGEIDSALSLISQLHPVTYDWNEQRKEGVGAG